MKQINLVLIFLMLVMVLVPIFLPDQIDEKIEYEIEAPIGLVFDEFSELNHFSKWEKFTQNDSTTLKIFHEAEENKNAYAEWKSNSSKVGNGKLKIENIEINKFVEYSLKYENWENEDILKFDFASLPTGNTKLIVNYTSQKVPYFYRYFLMFNSPVDKLTESIVVFKDVIKDRLKEERKGGNLIFGEFKVVTLDKQTLMAIKKVPNNTEKDANKSIEESLESIYKALMDEEGAYDFDLGFPNIYTAEYNLEKNTRTIFTGVKLLNDMPLPKGTSRVNIPAGDYLLTLHQGPKARKKQTIALMKNYAKTKKIILGESELEVLLNDPNEVDSLQLKSRIYIPIKSN